MLDRLTPEQWEEWRAFEQLEPSDAERLHAQLSAIGGAILYQLQILCWYVAHFVFGEDDLRELKSPRVPEDAALDPLRPRLPGEKRRPPHRQPSAAASDDRGDDGDCEFVSPAVAVSLLRAAVKR